ncbi:FUN14 domain-containing protein 1 isoform X1 [Erythrolamprus reginae]|uniref:FUN14 domain-containing protein 1 isoform X1 n=1 Tax=Erythrolamprus reginae TaxID=121349 RepID=UPI00396C364F
MSRRNRSASEHDSDDDSYEVLDLTEYARRHHWWNRVFGRNSGPIVEKYSVATQIVMGGITGWCAGFLFQKVGKLAATAVGGGFLLLQIASHSGYIQIDWKRVEKDVNKAKKQLKKRANKAAPEINTLIEELRSDNLGTQSDKSHHRFKVNSAFHPSKVGKMRTRIVGAIA